MSLPNSGSRKQVIDEWELPFSRQEYQLRCAKVRSSMEQRGLDALVVSDPSNMFYLTGYDGWSFYLPQAVVLFAIDEQPYWIGRPQDKYGARLTTWLEDDHIRDYSEKLVHAKGEHPGATIAGLIREMQADAGRIGLEMDAHYFTARGCEVVRLGLPKAELVDSEELVNWCRVVKTPSEIEYMRKAAKVASAAMAVATQVISPGERECDAAAAIVRAQYQGVGDIMGEYPAIVPLIPSRQRALAAHLTWTDRRYQEGDAVNIELSGCVRRYHAPLARTLCIGRPSAELFSLGRAVQEGLDAAISAMRPGETAEGVEAAWRAALERHGYTKESRLGYSVGIGYPPDWGEHTISLRSGDTTVLTVGMAFHIIGGMWLKEQGLELSETVVVTESGSEVLTEFERSLIVKEPRRARWQGVATRESNLTREMEHKSLSVTDPADLTKASMPNYLDVLEAGDRLSGHASPTPTLVFDELSSKLGAEIVLKMESMSDVGSFKWRGALNKILSLPSEVAKRGVVTYSTGNHGVAMAEWARRLGIPAQVCVPKDVGAKKLERLRGLGVRIDMDSLDQDQAASRCYELARETGATVIPPFDDPHVIAGQGTIGLEILTQLPDLDAVVVPVSGGGLVSGIGLAVRAYRPDVRIIGVCAENAAAMYASIQVGRVIAVEESATLADSLRGGLGAPNNYTFDLVSDLGIEMVQVSEVDIEEAMRTLLQTSGLIVEGAGAVGLAAIMAADLDLAGKKVVVVVSGRNVDADSISNLLRG